ncbi:hypothetical protein [Pedobacter gandavensis]|uniref:hypothetical protein n=1 Tax=Pedobacter gandavensis TaxID=2679963 RepID=UPI00292D0604|nr:hypothetical protein [Pedobacter gandavensis]
MNTGRIIFELLVVSASFTFSAFTNVNVKSNTKRSVAFDYLIQRVHGEFTQIDIANPSSVPDYGMCYIGGTIYRCVYQVTAAGKLNIPSLTSLRQIYYTGAQINNYLVLGYLYSEPGSIPALYWD